jgi:hypothetical protein
MRNDTLQLWDWRMRDIGEHCVLDQIRANEKVRRDLITYSEARNRPTSHSIGARVRSSENLGEYVSGSHGMNGTAMNIS